MTMPYVPSTIRYAPAGRRAGLRVVLAHGAGAGQKHPFMVGAAKALAARGLDVTTFDFPYVTAGRKIPDPPAVLEACARGVVESIGGPVVFGGKSMGGRIGSQIAPTTDAVRALFFLGYPLHPPGKPHVLRTGHWPRIRVPCLFVQGTRDAFGTNEEIAEHVTSLGARSEVLVVDGGDHSFAVPKRAGRSREEVLARIYDEVARFAIVNGQGPRAARFEAG